MPHSRFEWHERIKGVEREFRATRFGLIRLRTEAEADPGILRDAGLGKGLRAVTGAIENAEGTYLIRMFAEFENAIRSFWRTISATVPAVRDLVDGVGSRRRVPHGSVENVHRVRDYRNSLVHDEFATATGAVAIAEAGQSLNIYLRRLPESWD